MSTSKPTVAVIGSGYWGKNLVRQFHRLNALRCVCDVREDALTSTRYQYGVDVTTDYLSVLADPQLHGVVIATPAAQHFEHARQALLAGKDVYVEKPLALHAAEGRELVAIAAQRGRILMVGHILEYHSAILQVKELIARGELGRIQYIYSSRLNLGKLRTEENILWSFAPHDISVILFLLGEMPVRVTSQGGKYVDPKIYDTTLTTCEFNSGVKAHFFVSWLHPFKEQKLAIVGGKRMAVFDDVDPERKLVLYSHRIDWRDRMPVASKDEGQWVRTDNSEPLARECEHFLHCVTTRQRPRTDGSSAVRVLQVLEACERSLIESRSVQIGALEPEYFADPTAIIDSGCRIGMGTKIWHFSHVLAGSIIGARCNIGQNVVIGPDVQIGNNVKIQNNVSVYKGVILEDDVFCGPSMVFTNVINPRSDVVRKHEYKTTHVKRGASIGANATVVCGVTLGQYSFVGAGAVVTRDVPDYALVTGVPAKQTGWVCRCGVRLRAEQNQHLCNQCGRAYLLRGGTCQQISRERELTLAA